MKPRPTTEAPRALYGVLDIGKKGIFVKPASRLHKFTVELDRKNLNGAQDGEIVFVRRPEIKPREAEDNLSLGTKGKKEFKNNRWQERDDTPHGPKRYGAFEVVERLGSAQDVRNYSFLSMLEAGLQPNFPPKVIDACMTFKVPELGTREDLRHLPLVTIDGEDARDFDDAVYARPEGDGWYALVAIADVAHYVRPGTDLDKEALRRGNSTYFPDRVVPMLPERLSNDLCSLRPNEPRACMHAHIWFDGTGKITDWKIGRGLMKSVARLTYNQVQKALDGQPDEQTSPLLEQLQYLYKGFRVLLKAREERGALEINAPERKVVLDGEGGVKAIVPRERLEAHQLIEEYMITANVVVATALESKGGACMYRVHDTPSAFKVATLAQFLKPLGMTLPIDSAEMAPELFNEVLRKVQETPDLAPVINDLVLRSQAQAVYLPENNGHFGLALERYAHFTSPIRRYADLINHRSLITAFGLGDDGLAANDAALMEEWAEQISQTERNSAMAERGCVDRFTAHFLQSQLGKELPGRITSVTSFGLFISLLDGVGEALVPMRMLPNDFYEFIEEQQVLVGGRSGRVYRLGGKVTLMIINVDPILGSVTGQLVGHADADLEGFEKPRPMGKPGRGGFDRGDRGDRGGRRDFGDKPKFGDKPRFGDKKGFGDKPRFEKRDDDRRPPREDRFDPAPRFEREDREERPRRSFGDRPDRGGEDRPRRPYGDRPDRGGDRPQRSFGDRPARPAFGDDKPRRSYRDRDEGGEERPRRSYGDRPDRGGDRPQRSFGDRPARPSFGDDKPRRAYGDRPDRGGDDRPKRSYGDRPSFEDRPKRSFGDRPQRGGDEDRPRRSYGDRPDRGDRPQRSYGDRPSYGERSDSRRGGEGEERNPPYRGGRNSKPYAPRGDRPDRGGDDRPRRSFGDRPERGGDDRPRRPYGDRPDRGGDDRPKRSYGDRPDRGGEDRPRRAYGDRPNRGGDDGYKPRSDGGPKKPGGFKGKSDGFKGPKKPFESRKPGGSGFKTKSGPKGGKRK